jgi:hypothetical protein
MMKKSKFFIVSLLIFGVVSSVFAEDAAPEKASSTKLTGHLQFRNGTYKTDETGDSGFSEQAWQFKRLRLGLTNESADKDYGGNIYLKLENALKSANTDEDLALIYAYGWIKPIDMLKLVGGLYKVPFARESTRSSTRMYVDEWGSGSGTLFDTGAYAQITPIKPLDIFLNVSNGAFYGYLGGATDPKGGGNAGAEVVGKTDDGVARAYYQSYHPLTSLRVQYQVLGKNVLAGDEAFAPGMGLNLGAAYAMNQRFGPSRALSAYNVDGAFYMDGAVFTFAYSASSVKDESVPAATVTEKGSGIMVEAGYNIKMGQRGIMPAIRFEMSAKNSGATGAKDVKKNTLAIAVNYFFDKHNQRFSLTYGTDTSDATGTKVKTDRITFEYQFVPK